MVAGLLAHILVGVIGVERLTQWLKGKLGWTGRKVQYLAFGLSALSIALTMIASQALNVEQLLNDPVYWLTALIVVWKAAEGEHAMRKAGQASNDA